MADVELRSVTKIFGQDVRALDEIDLQVEDGEFFALLGPSGCGKTTLLRTVAGLEPPSEGEVIIGGEDVTRRPAGERNVGMVFQDYALYPHMSVNENIAYPLKVRRVSKEERFERAAEAAGNLGMGELLERRPDQLSGGQQQRVALARAIAHHPAVFLFDEPLSNLDARLRLESRTFLKRLQHELGTTTIYVTHDQAEALALADRMAVMQGGQIRQVATPREVYTRPTNLFVASFIGSVPMNLLVGEVHEGSVRIGQHEMPLPTHARDEVGAGEEVVFGLRPEHAEVSVSERPGAFAGEVVVSELLGTENLLTVEREGLSIQAITREDIEPGTDVWVTPDVDLALLYRYDDGGLVGTASEGKAGELSSDEREVLEIASEAE